MKGLELATVHHFGFKAVKVEEVLPDGLNLAGRTLKEVQKDGSELFSKENSRLEEVPGEGLESGKDARLQEVPGEGLESSNSRCRFQEVPAVGLEFYVSKVKFREAPPDGLDMLT